MTLLTYAVCYFVCYLLFGVFTKRFKLDEAPNELLYLIAYCVFSVLAPMGTSLLVYLLINDRESVVLENVLVGFLFTTLTLSLCSFWYLLRRKVVSKSTFN